MKVKLKNGRIGELVGNAHIIFDNGDGYSYTIPASDIEKEIKYEKQETKKTRLSRITEENFNLKEARSYIFATLRNKFPFAIEDNFYVDDIIKNSVVDYITFQNVYRSACAAKCYRDFERFISFTNNF